MRAIAAKCESRCGSLTLSCRIHLRQLLGVELIQHQLDLADGAEQIAAALQSSLGGNGCALCTDGRTVLALIRTALPMALQPGQRWYVFLFSQQSRYEQTASAPGDNPGRNIP